MLFLVSVNQLVLQIIYPLCEPANAFVVSSNIRGLLLCC